MANRLDTAFTGIWTSTFSTLGFFGVLGLLSTGLADWLRRPHRRVLAAFVPYFELYLSTRRPFVHWVVALSGSDRGLFYSGLTVTNWPCSGRICTACRQSSAVLLGVLAMLAYS